MINCYFTEKKMSNIISSVAKTIEDYEHTQSSHWQKYHSNFQYSNGRLNGLEGFGTNNPPLKGFKKIIYYTLLKRYTKHQYNKQSFKNIKSNALSIVNKQKRAFDLDVLRHCLTIDFLNHHKVLGKDKTVVVIGDGWGIMSTLLLKMKLAKRVILVNLNKTLLVDLTYLNLVLPEIIENSVLLEKKEDVSKLGDEKLIAIRADNYELIQNLSKDVAINIASFQEMNIDVVNNYLNYIESNDKEVILYHCNRISKELPDGKISSINDYIFNKKRKYIIDEECPWHIDFISQKPPFIFKFDGKTHHQLIKLNL